MELVNTFKKFIHQKSKPEEAPVVQIGAREAYHPFSALDRYAPLGTNEYELYSSLREAVPIIDAALDKLVRLAGTFKVECKNEQTQKELNIFLKTVKCSGGCFGIDSFLNTYLNQLLTYGTAVGEIVLTGDGRDIYSIINVPLKRIELAYDKNNIDIVVCENKAGGQHEPLPYQELILLSALNPQPGRLAGTSLLKGLPFVSSVLLKIFNSIGVNWERVGNVRFAVTYKPSGEGDRAMGRQRAVQIAQEWSKAMRDTDKVSDFVSVGDVSVKVIGADNQVLDSSVPIRQLLEQILSKLSVPPFMLGLSWSTTERMSSQQADILTSEIDCYRRVLNTAILKLLNIYCQLHGIDQSFDIVWDNINLQDEVELARANLYNAQAEKIRNG